LKKYQLSVCFLFSHSFILNIISFNTFFVVLILIPDGEVSTAHLVGTTVLYCTFKLSTIRESVFAGLLLTKSIADYSVLIMAI
jgi:hypothetical protein